MAHLQGQARARYVQEMFGRIAGRYNLMNRLMTFGQDMTWRRFVIERAALPRYGRLLDLATGTGDIAFTAVRQSPSVTVVGADFSMPMMRVGRSRAQGHRVHWCQTDALALPYPANTFDAVVSGYLLRNVIDLPRCLAEQVRVTRPGGMVVALDTTPPPHNALRPFLLFHLRYVIPLLGRAVAGAADAYEYLPNSTQSFKEPEELSDLMADAGLVGVRYRTFMFGTMAVHWGQKPPAAAASARPAE